MKVSRITKLPEKYLQYDITTETENFYVKTGDSYVLIHNSPQLYWGRDKDGNFTLSGHNGWSKKVKPQSPEELYKFIAHESGSPKTPEEQQSREEFALHISHLWPIFERATPKSFRGYVYADALFLSRPDIDNDGVYNFCPNPKSKTCYHVRSTSELGKKISQADIMVVGHARFKEFGLPDSEQTPMREFDQFNTTGDLIVLGPIYNRRAITVNKAQLQKLIQVVGKNHSDIDDFLQGTAGLSDIKQIIYKYINTSSKNQRLDQISRQDFLSRLAELGVSSGKQQKIAELDKNYPSALNNIMELIKQVQVIKDNIIDQVEKGATEQEIWDTHGEGRVRYADDDKQFGHIKLVPRKRWTPS